VLSAAVVAVLTGFGLVTFAGVRPFFAALIPLQVVWVFVRPEVVRVSAPALVVVMLWQPLSWALIAPVVLALLATWAAVEMRLTAGRRQRQAALAAAGGVTAPLPTAGKPVPRGSFLLGLGALLFVLGVILMVTAPLWGLVEDQQGNRMTGLLSAGLGLTALLSGRLGRRRAAALRGGPVPVLRVLMRDDVVGDSEVCAADDLGALRPLFTVSVQESDDEGDNEDGGGRDGRLDDEELDRLLDELDDDPSPGPLREAVLYGVPYDGAEVVLVSAPPEEPDGPDEQPDERPVVEWSVGPVRPLSERAVRRRVAGEKRAATRKAVYEARRDAAGAARLGTGAVRRWRAGWVDWLFCLALVLWGVQTVLNGSGVWRYGWGGVIGVIGALAVPGALAWRVTADRTGLWVSGLLGTRHIAWDHLTTVRYKGTELKLDSRRASFSPWTAHRPRWVWLERRFGLVHPYEKVVAEITAMRDDPALRPAEESGERERGRPLWPVAVLFSVVWAVALVLGS
jgi:hypothetical protein